jgi:hypothetical protein
VKNELRDYSRENNLGTFFLKGVFEKLSFDLKSRIFGLNHLINFTVSLADIV